ncbi:MAG: hypothetical protein SGJ27_09665, partial [Candidatus Melainabacteria bacterium]|nr:hypothetical protein [Candidatus Melainabacteria bacterium]
MTILIVLGVIALLFVCAALWIRSKARRGISWVKVSMLEAALKELRQKADKPGQEPDPELPALTERVETALTNAKAAHAKGDWNAVAEAADKVLAELFQRVSDQAKKEADAEEKARLAGNGKVIDGTVIDVTPTEPAALPAPTSCAALTSDAQPTKTAAPDAAA